MKDKMSGEKSKVGKGSLSRISYRLGETRRLRFKESLLDVRFEDGREWKEVRRVMTESRLAGFGLDPPEPGRPGG